MKRSTFNNLLWSTPHPSRELDSGFTANVISRLNKESIMIKPKLTLITRLGLGFGAAALTATGTIAATGNAPAVIKAVTQTFEHAITSKTDPQTGRTELGYDPKLCTETNVSYIVEPGISAEEGAKYLQANCEMNLAYHQLHELLPTHIADTKGLPAVVAISSDPDPEKKYKTITTAQGVTPPSDPLGWTTHLATYRSGNGSPYVEIKNTSTRLDVPTSTPILTASTTRLDLADLRDGDAVMVTTKGQPFTDTAAGRDINHYLSTATVQTITRLNLPLDYYWANTKGALKMVVPCPDDSTKKCDILTGRTIQ